MTTTTTSGNQFVHLPPELGAVALGLRTPRLIGRLWSTTSVSIPHRSRQQLFVTLRNGNDENDDIGQAVEPPRKVSSREDSPGVGIGGFHFHQSVAPDS